MSAWIVSETGVVTEIPRCNLLSWESFSSCYAVCKEKTGETERFICRVPNGHLVTFDRPNVVQQAADARSKSMKESLLVLAHSVDMFPLSRYGNSDERNALATLKRKLASFDCRKKEWKS
jgi:hypothetical protein